MRQIGLLFILLCAVGVVWSLVDALNGQIATGLLSGWACLASGLSIALDIRRQHTNHGKRRV